MAAAMSDLLDRRNLPMLVHCNKGEAAELLAAVRTLLNTSAALTSQANTVLESLQRSYASCKAGR